MKTVVKLRWNRGIGHDRVTIFTGPNRDHLANAGTLVFRSEEAEAFRASIRQGSGNPDIPGFSGVLESGWGSE